MNTFLKFGLYTVAGSVLISGVVITKTSPVPLDLSSVVSTLVSVAIGATALVSIFTYVGLAAAAKTLNATVAGTWRMFNAH